MHVLFYGMHLLRASFTEIKKKENHQHPFEVREQFQKYFKDIARFNIV